MFMGSEMKGNGSCSDKLLPSKTRYCADTVGVCPSTILIWKPSVAIP
jgi:hypothetical protein